MESTPKIKKKFTQHIEIMCILVVNTTKLPTQIFQSKGKQI